MSVDELDESEIDRRFNHWDENDSVEHCSNCGAFISKPNVEHGQARYHCNACERWILDYRG